MSEAAALYEPQIDAFTATLQDVEGVVAACRKAAQPLPAVIAPVHFYFPAGDGGYREDLSAVHYVQLGRWSTVTMPVPISLNRASVIRIDPGNTPGLVTVATLRVRHAVTGGALWEVAEGDWREVTTSGTAARLPSEEHLIVLAYGVDPQILLPPWTGESVDGPLEIEMVLKN